MRPEPAVELVLWHALGISIAYFLLRGPGQTPLRYRGARGSVLACSSCDSSILRILGDTWHSRCAERN